MTGIRASVLISVQMVALAVLVATGDTVPALAQADELYKPHKQMWAAKRANVRAGPSTSHEKVGLLEVGDRAAVVARTGDWFKLYHRAGQLRRFVYAPLLSEVKPSASRPAVSQSAASTATVKTINLSNGDRYRGQIRNGNRHGRGVYTWADGGSYDGEWLDGDFHGRGVRIFANGNRYEGDYVKDKRTGRGVFRWPSGLRYRGDFRDNKQTGHGIYTWPNGNRYEGGFVDGEFHGQGIWTFPNGNRIEVEYRNGQRVSGELVVQPGRKKTEIQRNTAVRGREETVQAVWAAYSQGDDDTPGSDDTAAIGLAWGGSSKQDTVDKAISECEKAGGGDSCRRYTHAEEVPCVAVVRNTWSNLDGESWVVLFGGLGETEDSAIADARSGSRGRDTCYHCAVYDSRCAY